MNNDTTTQFVRRGAIQISDEYLIIADPHQLQTEYESALWVFRWQEKTANCFTVSGQQPDYPRAMVVTLRDTPPVELLQKELSGAFAFVDLCAVDSGMAAIVSGEYSPLRPRFIKPGIHNNALFVEFTYMGDGQFPIAVWAENGLIHTVAVLTDRAYYDAGWR